MGTCCTKDNVLQKGDKGINNKGINRGGRNSIEINVVAKKAAIVDRTPHASQSYDFIDHDISSCEYGCKCGSTKKIKPEELICTPSGLRHDSNIMEAVNNDMLYDIDSDTEDGKVVNTPHQNASKSTSPKNGTLDKNHSTEKADIKKKNIESVDGIRRVIYLDSKMDLENIRLKATSTATAKAKPSDVTPAVFLVENKQDANFVHNRIWGDEVKYSSPHSKYLSLELVIQSGDEVPPTPSPSPVSDSSPNNIEYARYGPYSTPGYKTPGYKTDIFIPYLQESSRGSLFKPGHLFLRDNLDNLDNKDYKNRINLRLQNMNQTTDSKWPEATQAAVLDMRQKINVPILSEKKGKSEAASKKTGVKNTKTTLETEILFNHQLISVDLSLLPVGVDRRAMMAKIETPLQLPQLQTSLPSTPQKIVPITDQAFPG